MNGLETVDTENVTQSAYMEADVIQKDIDNTTTPKSLQGTPESGRLGRTAAGAQMIIGQALEKFGTAAKMVEEHAIKRLLRMVYELDKQMLSDESDMEQYKPIFGKLDVTVEMLHQNISFVIKGISEMIDKEGKINQIASWMGMFGPAASTETISTLMKKTWGLMGFDPDEVNLVAQRPMPVTANAAADVRTQLGEGASPAVKEMAQNGSVNTAPGVPSTRKA
jgi:hypothetical protein